MTFLSFINNWREFEILSPFLVIAVVAWHLFQYLKFERAKSKLQKETDKECDELEAEVLSKYTESEIEKVRICKTLIWKLRNERKEGMTWNQRKEMSNCLKPLWKEGSSSIWRLWNSQHLRFLEQQMIIDGKKEGEINCIECHKKSTIDFWKKQSSNKSEFSTPDLAWKVHEIASWESLTRKANWSKDD